MFVRWKKRDLRRGGGRVLYAVVVENHRLDGKVRQKVLKHLATIKERRVDAVAHQEYFWQRVDWCLEEMQIEPAVRQEIEVTLAATVPRPPVRGSAEWAAYESTYFKLHKINMIRHGSQAPPPTRAEVLAALKAGV